MKQELWENVKPILAIVASILGAWLLATVLGGEAEHDRDDPETECRMGTMHC